MANLRDKHIGCILSRGQMTETLLTLEFRTLALSRDAVFSFEISQVLRIGLVSICFFVLFKLSVIRFF